MVFIDSNVWIGYFNNQDKHHQNSKEIIQSIKNNNNIKTIYITSGIIHEVTNYLFKIKSKNRAKSVFESICAIPNLKILFLTDALWLKTIENFYFYEMSLTDAQIISAMQEMGDNTLYSFDRHFDQVKWLGRIPTNRL